MQQGLPSGDVFRPRVSARFGALDVDASSVGVDRELPDSLAGGGFAAATAAVSATLGADSAKHVATPWDPGASWPPAPEAPARVEMDMGVGPVQALTGRVTAASGGTSSREVQVEVADLYQTLDRTISWDELSDAMPSTAEGGSVRFVGLHSAAITDHIFRHCGWYATPPRVGFTVFSVPAMGTMWPEVGTLDTCDAYMHPDQGSYPFFNGSSWGMGVNRVDATYSFGSYSLNARSRMEMMVLTDDITAHPDRDSMFYRAITPGGQYFSISWTPSTVNVWATGPSGTAVLAGQGARVPGALVYVKVDRVSATSVTVQTRIANTVVDTRTVTVHGSLVSQAISRAWIRGDMMGGGFQLAFPGSTANSLDNWSPSAMVHTAGTSHMLKFRPVVAGDNCAELLRQQCEAQGAAFWIDELGVLQWWDLQRLESEPSRATLTAGDHVREGGYSWSHDLSSVKSRVVVKWTDWLIRHSLWSRIPFWQASAETMSDGDVSEQFINCPDNEVWIAPDLLFTRIGDAAGPGGGTTQDFNRGRRSWWGAVLQDSGDWAYGGGSGFLSFAIERINGVAFKYTITRSGAVDAELRTPDAVTTTSISRNKRSMDLPILRGKMKYELLESEYMSAQTGPPTAPEHVIDAGWWIQEESQAQRIADYAASRVTVAHPVLSAVDIVPAPGIQLGDIVTVVDNEVSRLTVRGVVVADSRAIDDGMSFTHSITIRPLSVSRNGVTWEEWGTFVAGATHQTWGASQAGKTWAQWGASPVQS